MSILVLIEHDNQSLNASNYSVITAAMELAQKIKESEQSANVNIDVLIAGYNAKAVTEQAKKLPNINNIIHCDNAAYQYGLAENIAALLHSLAADYQYIIAPADTFGKNIMPRLAALLDTMQISDVTKIIEKDTFLRPIYAGNAIETVQNLSAIKVLTIRTTAFDKCKLLATAGDYEVKAVNSEFDLQLSKFINLEVVASERPDLTMARVVISGGRGLQSKENFQLVEQLADKLQAAIGASRAAVDAGFIGNDHQVGQTGKVVAPELYIAIGISGAIQHLAGMKDSKIIVAINKDPEAPIFQLADYGLVGDLFKLVPELIAAL